MTGKGNKKGNIWGQTSIFADPPPGVVDFLWRVRGRTPPPLQPITRIINEETDQDRVDGEVQHGPQ